MLICTRPPFPDIRRQGSEMVLLRWTLMTRSGWIPSGCESPRGFWLCVLLGTGLLVSVFAFSSRKRGLGHRRREARRMADPVPHVCGAPSRRYDVACTELRRSRRHHAVGGRLRPAYCSPRAKCGGLFNRHGKCPGYRPLKPGSAAAARSERSDCQWASKISGSERCPAEGAERGSGPGARSS